MVLEILRLAFFKMAAVHHHGLLSWIFQRLMCNCGNSSKSVKKSLRYSNFIFVGHTYEPPKKSTLYCRLIGSSFGIWKLEYFRYLAWKSLFGPRSCRFGYPNVEQNNATLKRHILVSKHVIWRIHCQSQSTVTEIQQFLKLFFKMVAVRHLRFLSIRDHQRREHGNCFHSGKFG